MPNEYCADNEPVLSGSSRAKMHQVSIMLSHPDDGSSMLRIRHQIMTIVPALTAGKDAPEQRT